jgi:TonB-linked SusC/RagA family outer membrane protein
MPDNGSADHSHKQGITPMLRIGYVIVIALLAIAQSAAQDRTITGKVSDQDGKPVGGAVVQGKASTVGTFTKPNGTYSIKVRNTVKALVFKLIGKKTTEVEIGDKTEIDVVMKDDAVSADEVVVTAIGLERSKKSLGYATQEVDGKALVQSRETNVVSALSGKVAGVQVINSTGVPGASAFIRIRGNNSITGNNQPLFVVDGIPIDNSQSFSGNPDNGRNNLLDGVAYSNRAIDLNPNDIEDMTVLKGPAATALYGIRAAGGAIIITTKKGRPQADGKLNVNFNSTMSIDQVNRLPELQNKYSQGSGGAFLNPAPGASRSWGAAIDTLFFDDVPTAFDSRGSIVGASDPRAKTKMAPHDNLADFFRTGYTYDNSVNMSGGNENGTFYVSFGNLTSNGIVPNSTWERNTVKASGAAQISTDLRASANMTYVNSGGQRIQQGSNVSGVMLGLLRTPPSYDNSYGFGADAANTPNAYSTAAGTQRTYRAGVGYDNPFWTVNKNPFTDDVNRLYGNVQLDWGLMTGVDLVYRIGADVYSDRRKQIFAINSRSAPTGRVFEDQQFNRDITSDLILTITQELDEDWDLQVLLGNNLFSTYGQQVFVQGDGLGAQGFFNLSNASSVLARESIGQKRTMAMYGDVRLSYMDALFINVTARNEWSTSLPENNNSFFYPAVSVSAVLTDLIPELKNDILSYMQVRSNFAMVGKDAPIYATVTTYGQGGAADGWTDGVSFPFNGVIGYSKGNTLGAADLRPEMTTSWEVGFDVRFLDNMFGLDFTYYNSLSEDQIFSVPIAASSGFGAEVRNAGSISNNGFEVVFNASPLRGDINWDINLNFTQNFNKVESLAPGVDQISLGGFLGASVRAVAGQAYGSIYGFGWARDSASKKILIDDDPNSPSYGQPILDPEERAFGSANPDWLMGVRNSFSWNGLTLSFLFDIRQGGYIWNGTRSALIFFGTAKETEARGTTKVFDGVKASTGQPNDIVATLDENWFVFGNGNGFFGSNSEDFIEDASFVRLRELTLSYALPTDIVNMLPIAGATLTFTGRNLWLSTEFQGIDPETSLTGASNAQGIEYFNMPNTKSYVFSLSLNF